MNMEQTVQPDHLYIMLTKVKVAPEVVYVLFPATAKAPNIISVN
jgi:hypothetical protein